MSAELVILIPVLARPHRVEPVLESALAATPKARVVFIPDPDDQRELRVLEAVGAEHKSVKGNYATKINALVRETDEPLLFFGADDLEFHARWLDHAKAALAPGIGVVATNDLCNDRVKRGELATHPLVTREYVARGTVDEDGKVLHEGYWHEYVDREFSETAQERNAFAYAPKAIVEHLHPMVGKAPVDKLYAQTLTRMRQGHRLYSRRRRLWMNPNSRFRSRL